MCYTFSFVPTATEHTNIATTAAQAVEATTSTVFVLVIGAVTKCETFQFLI